MKKNTHKSANALLVSIILGSILITLGLSVNGIIIRQIRAQYDYLQGMQSYYSMQASVEEGLYSVRHELPGYEITDEQDINADTKNDYNLVISSKSQSLPCEQDSKDSWYTLGVQNSLRIPLFVADEDGKQKEIEDFVVEYYVDRPENSADFVVTSGDIIKWAVMGVNSAVSDDIGYLPESIQDYIPMQEGRTSEENPSKFGTSGSGVYTTAKFYEPASYANISETTEYNFYDNYSIDTFLENHISNYLIIENVIDLSRQAAFCDDPACNNVKFRVVAVEEDTEFACQVALIEADGYANNVKQSINVRDSVSNFLPVFDFALFAK